MKLEEIIAILNNRLASLTEARKNAVSSGNLEQVMLIDSDILSTQTSIDQLNVALVG